MKKYIFQIFLLAGIVILPACENVEDGYRVDYIETPASFSVTLNTIDRGAVGEAIIFSIQSKSDYNIKSIVVNSEVSGGNGTGFVVDSSQTDPLIDHAYGTIQKGTKEIDLSYNYVIENDSLDPVISFTLVDEYGSKTVQHNLYAVPSVVVYDSIVLYSQSVSNADGFSSYDGYVYHRLADYEDVTVVNEQVQESLDIVFLISNGTSVFVAPYSGTFTSGMSVRNKTLFKLLPDVTSAEFDNLTPAGLSKITEEAEVKNGSTGLWDIKTGDIIGFRTDFASTNPYRFGILRINAIHPTNCQYYEGISYMVEFDVVTQK